MLRKSWAIAALLAIAASEAKSNDVLPNGAVNLEIKESGPKPWLGQDKRVSFCQCYSRSVDANTSSEQNAYFIASSTTKPIYRSLPG